MTDKLDRRVRRSVQQMTIELSPQDVDELLSQLCTKAGFCLGPEDKQRLIKSPPMDVIGFTRAVFVAEGLDPDLAPRDLYRSVSEIVYATFLQ